ALKTCVYRKTGSAESHVLNIRRTDGRPFAPPPAGGHPWPGGSGRPNATGREDELPGLPRRQFRHLQPPRGGRRLTFPKVVSARREGPPASEGTLHGRGPERSVKESRMGIRRTRLCLALIHGGHEGGHERFGSPKPSARCEWA